MKLPMDQWLDLMADTVGMSRGQFRSLPYKDRCDLLAAAAGMPYPQFMELGKTKDATAQAEAIRKHSGKAVTPPPVKAPPLPKGEAEAVKDGEAGEEPAEPAEGQGEGEAEAEAEGAGGEGEGGEGEEDPDPTVTLKGLASFLEPFVQRMVEERLKDVQDEAGPARQVIEVKLPDLKEVRKLKGHVHPLFERVLKLAAMGLPIMLVGPAGTGKTTMARMVADALGRPFGSVSCTAGMSEGELVGKLLPNETGGFSYRTSQFVTLYEGGGVFLVDEMDAADPNVLLKVNQSIGTVRGSGSTLSTLTVERSSKRATSDHLPSSSAARAMSCGLEAGSSTIRSNAAMILAFTWAGSCCALGFSLAFSASMAAATLPLALSSLALLCTVLGSMPSALYARR